jgi:uncharacterized membrane protein
MDETMKPKQKTSIWRWVLLGLAVVLTAVWLFLTPSGLLGKADAVGYAVCHRIDARSFHIHDTQFPLCARCSGTFIGAMLGLVFQSAFGRKGKMPPVLVLVLFGVLALAWALDGSNSFLMLLPVGRSVYQTQNWTRLVTGTGMGLAISVILRPAFIQTIYKTWEDESVFDHWQPLVGLLLAAALLDVLILLEIPWILYPLALVGSLGVVVLLVIIYSMVWTMITNHENKYASLREAWVPMVAGYITALLQIGIIDLLRYIWTGTWAGFVM